MESLQQLKDHQGNEEAHAPCRVRITQCSYESGWYKDLIGEEFDVDNAGGGKDYVLWEDYSKKRTAWRHIKNKDCEILKQVGEIEDKTANYIIESYPHFRYDDGTMADKDVIRAMREFAASRLAYYKSKLIEDLHNIRTDDNCQTVNDIIELIAS